MSTSRAGMLTERFEQALVYAARLHAGQTRKRSPVPYIAHLLSVTALVLEDGGSEDEAIAALLHDAVEDQGGMQVLEAIRSRFGERVASIVDGCTDAYVAPKPPWQERKEAFIARLKAAGPEVHRVSLADKVHNARTIVADLRVQGAHVWAKFNGGKSGTLWYYQTLLSIYREVDASPLVAELEIAVAEMLRLGNA